MDPPPFLQRGFLDGAEADNAGAVDQDVQAAQAVFRFGENQAPRGFVGDIVFDGERVPARDVGEYWPLVKP